ncbi:MAG: GGDEF domain-containing protein [Bacteriovoracaceae bacterium]
MNKHTRELLRFMGGFVTNEDHLHLINSVAEFLKNSWGTSDVLSFSFSKKMLASTDVQFSFRNLLNKPLSLSGLKKSEVYEFLEYVKDSQITESNFVEMSLNNKNFMAIYCGEGEHQAYICVFTLDDPSSIPKDQIPYLVEFCTSSCLQSTNLKKLREENALVDVDDVTGLFNSRRLGKDVQEAISRHKETGETFAILFVDIDHFKRVNDGHGHLIGTKLLSDMARVLKYVLRKTDYLYRYGGDEFVIIVRGANTENAKMVGERALKTVKEKIFGGGFENERSTKFRLSVSIGIASYPENASSSEEVMALADQMMYQAKSEGRGKVCLATDLFKKIKKDC